MTTSQYKDDKHNQLSKKKYRKTKTFCMNEQQLLTFLLKSKIFSQMSTFMIASQ